MSNLKLKALYPHAIALGIFLALAGIYFMPVLQGKVANQHDVSMWKGAYQEVGEFKKKTGETTMWSNAMFGGMPSYTYGGLESKANITPYIDGMMKLWLPSPMETIWLLMLCFYIFLISYGVSPWLGVLGAIAYGFSSYNFINLDAGHLTKGWAIAYLPLIFAGLNITMRYNKWLGAAVTGLAMALELNAGHIQITYYAMLLVVIWGVVQLVFAIREKQIKQFAAAALFAVAGAGIGVGTGTTGLLIGSEYAKESQRSPSELSGDEANKTTGLDKDYALEYSYSITEPLTILVADIYGGASVSPIGKSSATYKALKANNVPDAQIKSFVEQAPTYWGELRYTAGPTYFGAVVCFLFVLGFFVVKGKEKWWLLAGAIFSILLSYGKNFSLLTDFFFDHVLYYNKFRAVTFILILTQMCFPALGILALKEYFNSTQKQEQLKKSLLYALATVGGLLFILVVSASMIDFSAPVDKQLPDWLIEPLHSDRESIMRNDALRSLFFVLASFAGLWFMLSKKIKEMQVIGLLAALILIDLWTVDKRYLNDKDFVSKKKQQEFVPTAADQQILQDPALNYRVFNTTVSPFNDATTSYFHKSIGGYSAAKVRRYQDLIEKQIGNQNMQVFNMLNTRYFIVNDNNRQPMAQFNPGAIGNAWFVPKYTLVEGADAEMASLNVDTLGNGFNPRVEAFADKKFSNYLQGFTPQFDSTAAITLTDYKPNHLTYKSKALSEQLAIFAEVYYDKGWNAYVDGKPVEYIRANYVLRAMRVPVGDHTIEFKFEPTTYAKGENIARIFTITLYAGFVIVGGMSVFRYFKNDSAA